MIPVLRSASSAVRLHASALILCRISSRKFSSSSAENVTAPTLVEQDGATSNMRIIAAEVAHVTARRNVGIVTIPDFIDAPTVARSKGTVHSSNPVRYPAQPRCYAQHIVEVFSKGIMKNILILSLKSLKHRYSWCLQYAKFSCWLFY